MVCILLFDFWFCFVFCHGVSCFSLNYEFKGTFGIFCISFTRCFFVGNFFMNCSIWSKKRVRQKGCAINVQWNSNCRLKLKSINTIIMLSFKMPNIFCNDAVHYNINLMTINNKCVHTISVCIVNVLFKDWVYSNFRLHILFQNRKAKSWKIDSFAITTNCNK